MNGLIKRVDCFALLNAELCQPYFSPIALRTAKTLWSLIVLSATVKDPIALRMAKTLWSFGCSECNRVKVYFSLTIIQLSDIA